MGKANIQALAWKHPIIETSNSGGCSLINLLIQFLILETFRRNSAVFPL